MTARLSRLLASRWAWGILLVLYIGAVVTVLAPVVFSSIGADDGYWVLESAPSVHGSLWQAFWSPLAHAFDFTGQPRTTALATSDRRLLATATMNLATRFSIPPATIWAVVKLALVALGIVAVVVFLRSLRFRDRAGVVRRFQPATIAFVAIALPLTVALGAKAQSTYSLNGWLYYPTLSYGPIVVYLLLAAGVLLASRLLQRNYRVWVVPVVVIFALVALIINLSYELLALGIPVAAFVLLLEPLPEGRTLLRRWRAKLTVLIALVGVYSVIFVVIRWRVSQMACYANDTCYPGTVVELKTHTLLDNFIGAFPGSNGVFTVRQASDLGVPVHGVGLTEVAVAVIGVVALLLLWLSWNARRRIAARTAQDAGPAQPRAADLRGLVIVAVLAVLIAVGISLITGITENAVNQVLTPILPYRTGVVTWSAIALAIVICGRMLLILPWRSVRYGALAVFAIVLVVGISFSLPRNEVSAAANRVAPVQHAVDELQWEVALGDQSTAGDTRRCAAMNDFIVANPVLNSRAKRTIAGAYSAYQFYWHKPFCSTGLGQKS
jgi:hypothetical protein